MPRPVGRLEASWDPNFSPALPSIVLCITWLFVLCLTLPSQAPAWRLIRLASLPALAGIILPLSFDRRYTCGNPLRDLAFPLITWTFMCKTVEICVVYSNGGPRPIRPFLRNASRPVYELQTGNYGQYDWREVEFPALLTWDRLIYGVDVLFLRRPGTSPILPRQGRALEWSKRGLNEWARYLKLNECHPDDVPAHSPVRRFGQSEMPLWAGFLQITLMWTSFKWLYALAAPTSEMIDFRGLYIPVGSATSRTFWHAVLPSHFTRKHLVLLDIPSSVLDLPLPTRVAMTISIGGAVFLAPGFLESLVHKVCRPMVATSFLSSFDRPLTSPGLARFWARSWHATSQRDYLTMASMMPFFHHPPLQLLYVFFWSGVQQ